METWERERERVENREIIQQIAYNGKWFLDQGYILNVCVKRKLVWNTKR